MRLKCYYQTASCIFRPSYTCILIRSVFASDPQKCLSAMLWLVIRHAFGVHKRGLKVNISSCKWHSYIHYTITLWLWIKRQRRRLIAEVHNTILQIGFKRIGLCACCLQRRQQHKMIQEQRTKLNNTIKYGTQVSLNHESKKKKKSNEERRNKRNETNCTNTRILRYNVPGTESRKRYRNISEDFPN